MSWELYYKRLENVFFGLTTEGFHGVRREISVSSVVKNYEQFAPIYGICDFPNERREPCGENSFTLKNKGFLID